MKKQFVVGVLLLFLVTMGILAVRAVGSDKTGMAIKGGSTIGVIEINGVLGGTSTGTLMQGTGADSGVIMQTIRDAREREDIKAVVLRINSPGGTAVAAEEISIELDKLRETGKPVITSMGDVCASGGYWIACSSDYIVANASTLTGSIGSIVEISNLQGLYEKLGIKHEVIKSGDLKDMGSSARELTEQEKAIFEDLVGTSYERFLSQVLTGRKDKITETELLSIADGRVFSGSKASELGLVDSLGNYYDAINIAEQKAGIKKGSGKIEVINTQNFWDRLLLNVSAAKVIPDAKFEMRY